MDKAFLKVIHRELKRQGETLREFADEIKALSDEDKAWYDARLKAEGYYNEQ